MAQTNEALWLMAKQDPVMKVGQAPYPSASAGELVVRTKAVAINPADCKLQSLGILLSEYPAILGCDAAGVVEQVGEDLKSSFKPGDHVMGLTNCMNGYRCSGFQQYVVLKQPAITKLPQSVAFTDAAVLPLGIWTASSCLFDPTTLDLCIPPSNQGRGKTLIIWGASGSIGSCGVQLAVAAGYEVFAVASRHNHDTVKTLGATACFDYNEPDVVSKILAALEEKEVVGAFDAISEDNTIGPLCEILSQLSKTKKVIAAVSPLVAAAGKLGVEVRLNFQATIATDGTGKKIFTDFLEPALAGDKFLYKPGAQIVGHGLENIQMAVDQLSRGVSATKLVVTM